MVYVLIKKVVNLMISVSNLSVRFGKKALFEGITCKFVSKFRYGLIGANGVGKSTFMKILAGVQSSTEGEVFFEKDKRLSYLQQDHFKYDNFSVLDTVFMGHEKLYKIYKEREVLYSKEELTSQEENRCCSIEEEFSDLGGYEMDSQAGRLLKGLGIDGQIHNSLMKELTGARKFRTLLAQALFGNPDILLLDEPTNYLDIGTIEWLISFLTNYKGTLILISHDRYVLNAVCTQIADLDFQSLRFFTGNYDDFLIQNEILLERMRRETNKKEKRASELRNFISRFGANAARAKQATARQKELEKLEIEKMKPSSRVAPYIKFQVGEKLGQKVMEIKDISKSYDELLFSKFSYSVFPEDKIAIIGDNAVGKSTLVKILLGLEDSDSGSITLGPTAQIGYFPQDAMDILDSKMRALDWLAQYAPEGVITETSLRSVMGKMLFKGTDSEKPISVLSGGEKARLIIAKLLLEESNVLILDEPTNHLDLEAIEALNLALVEFDTVIIFVSHDKEFVNSVANRIFHINGKKIVNYPGNWEEYKKI